MDNTKRETFRRLLDSRLPKATKAVKLLGNLSRKGQYEYTHLEAQQLIKELQAEVNTLADKFKVTTTTSATVQTKPTEGELDRDDRGWVTWAYDMLIYGQKDEAMKMLHKVVGDFTEDRKKGRSV